MYKISQSNNPTICNPPDTSDSQQVEEKFTTPERIQFISNNNSHFSGDEPLAPPPRNQHSSRAHLLDQAGFNTINNRKKSIVRKALDERIDEIRKTLSLISFDLPAKPSATSDYSIQRIICHRTGSLPATLPDANTTALKNSPAASGSFLHR